MAPNNNQGRNVKNTRGKCVESKSTRLGLGLALKSRAIRRAVQAVKCSRPKKAPTGYSIFVREYANLQKRKGRQLTGIQVMNGAADLWGQMRMEKKKSYDSRVAKRHNRYKILMEEYKLKVQLLKRAPNGYALFTRNYWHFFRIADADFATMSRRCADAWKTLSVEAKNCYHAESCHLAMAHREMMNALANGENIRDFLPTKLNDPIPPNSLACTLGEKKGIEWFKNSCYMDASIFSMFAFNNAFDQILKNPNAAYADKTSRRVQKILTEKIINRLREGKMVKGESLLPLRRIFSKFDQRFTSQEMEPQEFLDTLFREILSVEHFIQIEDEEEDGLDYFHNVIMNTPASYPGQVFAPTIQAVIEESFLNQEIILKKPPYPALLLPLPNSEDSKPFTAIIPNKTLDLTELVSQEYERTEDQIQLDLSAVICYIPGQRHFVSFSKYGGNTGEADWIYFDSDGGDDYYPAVVQVKFMNQMLDELEKNPALISAYLERGDEYVQRILRDPYMYIYVPKQNEQANQLARVV